MSITADSSITVALIQVSAAIFCAALVAIQSYKLYRIEQGKLRIEKFSGINEKCELDVQPMIQGGTNETLTVTNKGTVPVDEMTVNIELLVERRKAANLLLSLKWSTNTLLSPKEATTIPLHEKLGAFLEQNNLRKLIEHSTGPDEDDVMYTATLEEQFSIMLDILMTMTIQKEALVIRKKYRLHYSWKDEPSAWHDDDYLISISNYMGEWTN